MSGSACSRCKPHPPPPGGPRGGVAARGLRDPVVQRHETARADACGDALYTEAALLVTASW